MSGKAEPVLVLDLGGTLLNRAGLGAFRRALAAVAGLGRDTEQQGVRDCVARTVLTGATAAVAAATLARDLQLPDDRRVLEALLQPEGDVALATGAPGLLRAGADNGWRIVAATNAAAWLPPLPDSIRSFFFAEVSSANVGHVKQEDAFWAHLKAGYAPDPLLTLVVGDQYHADILPARRSGYLAVQTGAGHRNLSHLADWLDAAGPPPAGTVAALAGDVIPWAGRQMIEGHHLRPLVRRTTRLRCVLHSTRGRLPGTVVRRQAGPPAVISDQYEMFPGLGWIVPRPDRRPDRAPRDLEVALAAAGLSLNALPPHDRRYLVSLVREARDRGTRARRIDEVVAHLQELGQRRGG
jgi:phosphoglycolate phosphatase-like HAD superfamily hydrolase